MGRRIKAYFTVEAALLFPVVTGCILFVVYAWIFQYNRCLMELDAGALAVFGSSDWTKDREEIFRELASREKRIYKEKYVAWERGETAVKIEKNEIRITQRGRLALPNIRVGGQAKALWETEAIYKSQIISPVFFVRTSRKILAGGK